MVQLERVEQIVTFGRNQEKLAIINHYFSKYRALE